MSPFYLCVVRIFISLVWFNDNNNVKWLNSSHFKPTAGEGYFKAILRHLKVAIEFLRHSSGGILHDFFKKGKRGYGQRNSAYKERCYSTNRSQSIFLKSNI